MRLAEAEAARTAFRLHPRQSYFLKRVMLARRTTTTALTTSDSALTSRTARGSCVIALLALLDSGQNRDVYEMFSGHPYYEWPTETRR